MSTIEIRSHSGTVSLYWKTNPPRGFEYELIEALEAVVGVERARVGRYSAELDVAMHVTTPEAVVKELVELFSEPNGMIREVFGTAFQHVEEAV